MNYKDIKEQANGILKSKTAECSYIEYKPFGRQPDKILKTISKKSLIAAIVSGMLVMSACGTAVQEQGKQTDNQNTGAQTADESDFGDSASNTENESESAAQASDTADTVAKPPKFLVGTNYYYNFYSGNYTEDADGESLEGRVLFQGKTEALMLAEESRDSFPDLYAALNDRAKETLNEADEYAESATDDANEHLETSIQEGYSFYAPYESNSSVSVTRADSKVVSFTDSYYDYMGGAHGMYGMSGTTYDMTSGKELTLEDVLDISEDDLRSLIAEEIKKNEDAEELWDIEETLSHYKYNPKEVPADDYENYEYAFDWYLGYDGIHFYFGPYELAAYAYGAVGTVLTYDDYTTIFDETFLPDENVSYITDVGLSLINSKWDSYVDGLHFVYEEEDEDYDSDTTMCKALTLTDGVSSATADVYFEIDYASDALNQYKVVMGDGREYVYVSFLRENDYMELLVFDISGGDISFVGSQGFHVNYESAGNGAYGEAVLTTPEYMSFGQAGDLFGTYTCYADYRVGDDGMPELIDEWYMINWHATTKATNKKTIEAAEVDEDGNIKEQTTIAAGMAFIPVRTDNESYVDCRLNDGRLIRLYCDTAEYPISINGEPIDDLFDGLMYAG